MEGLILKKGGLIEIKKWVYDEKTETGEYQYNLIEPDKENDKITNLYLLSLLSEIIELEDNFTVRDWFKLINNYLLFQMLDNYMEDYIQEYKNCPENNCIDLEHQVKNICFKKIGQIEKYKDSENKYFNTYVDVFGLGEDIEETNYGIDFWPLKNYLDIPIKLLPGIICNDDFTIKDVTKTHLTEKVNVDYTLYEFIKSFVYEISFYGTPEEKNKKGEELKEMVNKIDRGEVELIPFNVEDLKKGKGE